MLCSLRDARKMMRDRVQVSDWQLNHKVPGLGTSIPQVRERGGTLLRGEAADLALRHRIHSGSLLPEPCALSHRSHTVQLLFGVSLLRFRLHVVGNHEPVTIYFLIHVACDVIHLLNSAVLKYRLPGLLANLVREIAIDVNMRL